MRFIETPIFTREIQQHLDDEDYRSLQLALLFRPEQGALIKGSGGLRKIRWIAEGRGKRGGCRIIYYWDKEDKTIYMLFAYSKSRQEDLTQNQIKLLGQLVRKEFK
jgi:mRNA-degrading endonuclease RelE of RelBE toxin-antitoxin system